MTPVELIAMLSQAGIELWVEGDKLRFRAPKDALTPEYRDLLTQHKAEVIEILRERARSAVVYQPLSYSQQSMWFLNQSAPDSAAYHVAFTMRICSEVDTSLLRRVFQALVDRHPILRTVYALQNNIPVQETRGQAEVYFETIDAHGWSAASLQDQIVQTYRMPFDLEHGPVMRAHLFTLSSHDHVLLLVAHHIAVDGWSVWLLLNDFQALYSAYSTNQPAALPRLAVSYADFVRWQSDLLNSPEGQRMEQFWLRQLGGELPILNLPTDFPRPMLPSYEGASHAFTLKQSLTARLKDLAKAQGVTLHTLLVTVFQLLLHRYTGQDEILTGAPTFGRSSADFAQIVGHFINMVTLRTDFSGEPTFLDLLKSSRQVMLDALTNQDYPFPLLVQRLGGSRDPSRSPIFQVIFDLQRIQQAGALSELFVPGKTGQRADLAGMQVEAYPMHQQEGQFDLVMQIAEAGDTLPGAIKYSTDLFDAATIERMSQHFEALLESILANPASRISELPLLTPAERQQILVEWNDTHLDYPQDVCLHQLFEAQVERTPDATAVVFEDQHLTYRELNQRANQLAHHLHTLGVQPDMLVGVCMERSLEMVISLYAILKAGGAYVPMDPEYPPARLAYMLQDSNVSVLLTQEHLTAALPEHNASVIALDSAWETVALESVENPSLPTRPHHLAYMIYTSGSTGNPKGAMNTHRAIVNRLLWMQDAFHLDQTDHVMQKTPFSFDVSVWEFFWPLLVGARLVVARPGGHRDPAYLVNVIIQHNITTLHFVPSMLEQFVKEPDVASCTSIRRVICSGEALPLELQHRFFERLNTELHNLYGPTEAAVDVTWWVCDPHTGLRTVPIGKPIANTRMYILDKHMQPVPIGVGGELLIGGVQVARGYLNRPELTAEKFIPDPFSAEQGARLYRTGDLARYLPDGNIEYLGRIDHQIKLRGFRIELGEIESALAQIPGVSEALVMLREDTPGDKRLVGYLVANPRPSASDLRDNLKDRLPDYMIPSAFVLLDSMPLSPNGKADRKALPKPEYGQSQRQGAISLPQTPTEKSVAEAWQEVLNIQEISVLDNFFDLGGHSLKAMEVINKLNVKTGVKIDPAMMRFQTLGQLAASYDEAQANAEAAPSEESGLTRKLFRSLRRK